MPTGPQRTALTWIVACGALLAATLFVVPAGGQTDDDPPQTRGAPAFADVTAALGLGGVDGGAVAWGDIDGNGFVDLVIGQDDGDVVVASNTGTRFTTARVQLPAGFANRGRLVPRLADIDGDGDLDLALMPLDGGSARALENRGGSFSRTLASIGDDGSGVGYFLDIDGDGALDMVAAGSRPDGAGILVQRSGAFAPAFVEGFAPEEPLVNVVAYRDVANGTTRLMTGGSRFPAHEFRLDERGPVYSEIGAFSLTNVVDTIGGDFDGDLIDDILVMRSDRGASVAVNDDATEVEVEMVVAGGVQRILVESDSEVAVAVEPLDGLASVDAVVADGVRIAPDGGFTLDGATGSTPGGITDGLAVGRSDDEGFEFLLAASLPAGARISLESATPIRVAGDLRGQPGTSSSADYDTLLEWDGDRWTATRPFPTATDCVSSAAGDFDNDGDLDVFAVCPDDDVAARYLENLGHGEFVEDSMRSEVADDVSTESVATVADFDNDGFVDVLISDPVGSLQLLRNVATDTRWLGVSLIAADGGPGSHGAVVTVTLADGVSQRRDVRGAQQRVSQHDDRLHFGVGAVDEVERIVVIWPSGRRQVVDAVNTNEMLELEEPAADDPFAEVALENLRLSPVVEPGEQSEIRIDAVNIGTAAALNTIVTFELPEGWTALGLPPEATLDGSTVRWPVVDLGPGEIARLSLAVEAAERPGEGSLRVIASGAFPTQQLHRPLLVTDAAGGVSPLVIGFLVLGAVATVAIAVVLTVRRVRAARDDDGWYEAAIDLTHPHSAVFDPRPVESDPTSREP